MKRTLPIASHPAAFASTLPPTSDNVMTIPSDISTFMTVLLFPGPVHEAHYTTPGRREDKSPRDFTRRHKWRCFPVMLAEAGRPLGGDLRRGATQERVDGMGRPSACWQKVSGVGCRVGGECVAERCER